MAVTEFYRGGFNWLNLKGDPRTVEWDGTNEQDICDWFNAEVATFVAGLPSPENYANAPAWTATVTNGVATFSGWQGNTTGFGGFRTKTFTLGQGEWASAWKPQAVSGVDEGPLPVAGHTGMWKTQDPDSRPENVEDIFAPGTIFPWQ